MNGSYRCSKTGNGTNENDGHRQHHFTLGFRHTDQWPVNREPVQSEELSKS
jgi:hypothetical protein